MMNKKRKGFSLAELLIALLVISIVLSAAIPTLTRKSATSEQIWRWSSSNNSAYFGVGSNQSAIVGADSIPFLDDSTMTLADIISDDEINVANLKFSNYGDKLVLLKKSMSDNAKSHFVNSHISFYNMTNSAAATTNDIHYAGRIASDAHNLAFGIGSLQSMDEVTDTFKGNNTAIGHYTLMRNQGGGYNTAIGEKTLSFNQSGSFNTAVGYKSLFTLGGTDSDSIDASANTAIGSNAMQFKIAGSQNTAVGSNSLLKNASGDENTTVGYNAFNSATEGDGNTVIGSNACTMMTSGNYNICIGNRAGITIDSDINYGLFIGSGQDGDNDTPLISGFTQYDSTYGNDKELAANTRIFAVRTYDSGSDVFHVQANKGDNGYGSATVPADSVITMALYNIGGLLAQNARYTGLQFSADSTDIKIATTRTGGSTADSTNTYGNLNINDGQLKIDLSKDDKVNIFTDNNNIKEIQLNGKISVETNSTMSISLTEDYGFGIYSEDSSGSQLTMNDQEMYIYLPGDFTIDSNTLSISDSGVTIKSGSLTVGESNSVSIDNGDITIPGISDNGGLVGSTINNILQELEQLQQQIAASGGSFSDTRLKDISGDSTAGLKEINALEVKNFTFKDDKERTPHVGVIAQQLQKVFPNSVFEDKKSGYLKIKTEEIFYAMVNAIKELFAKIQDLTAKVTGLDERITELEKQNQLLLEQNKNFEKRLEELELQSTKE